MTLGAARVIWSINDLSMFIDELPIGYVTMVVHTERGPLNDPRVISSMEEYRKIFGKKVDYTNDPLLMEMCLRQGGRLNVIRAAHYEDHSNPVSLTAKKAELELNDRGDVETAACVYTREGGFVFRAPFGGIVTGTEHGPFTFGTGTSDKFKITVEGGAAQTVTLAGTTKTVLEVVELLKLGLTGVTVTNYGGRVRLESTDRSKSLTINTIAADAYSVLGFVEDTYDHYDGQTKICVLIDSETPEDVQEFELAGEEGELIFTMTASEVVAALSDITGASVETFAGRVKFTSDTAGSDSSIQFTSDSTALEVLGLNDEIHYGTDQGQLGTLLIEAINEGDWGNDLTIYIIESVLNPVDRFDLRIEYARQSDMMEYYRDLSMNVLDSRYVVNYINGRSYLIKVTDLLSTNTTNSVSRPELSQTEPYMIGINLAGGKIGWGDEDGDGEIGEGEYEWDEDGDWIGDPVLQTAMYAADNAFMSMDLMIPGTTNEIVYNALIAYCENRQDMISYGQVPFGLLPEDAVKWREGFAPTYSHPPFNSHRFALFFGWPTVYDDMDDKLKPIPCLGHLASCLCKTDNDYGYHFAPVGPRRGAVQLVEGIDFNINAYRSTGYADLFAEYGINYLMISRMPGAEGAMFWEQRTSQRVPSATRELNVMRFLTMMYRMIVPVLRTFLFEPNHPMTWREIHRVLEPALQDFKDKYRIYDFALQTDKDAFFDGGVLKNAVLNSGLDIDRGIYKCRALIQPTRTIYYLEFELGVTRTGEAFSQYTSLKELPGWIRR